METWIQLCYERDFDTGSPDGIKAYDRLSRFKHKLREEYQTEYYEIERLITTVSVRGILFSTSTVICQFDSVASDAIVNSRIYSNLLFSYTVLKPCLPSSVASYSNHCQRGKRGT